MSNAVRLFITDVDGTLTDGMYNQSDDGVLTKGFYTRDFWAIEELLKNGIKVVLASQASDGCVQQKAKKLAEKYLMRLQVFIGIDNKLSFLTKYLGCQGIALKETAYIGDAENDLECIRKVGFSACPSDAIPIIQQASKYVCAAKGGRGAVYEFINKIIERRLD